MILRLCLLVSLLAAGVLPVRAEPDDAVVLLWAEARDGSSRLGAGFFTSADGQLVTGYPLIAGAARIRVVTSDGWTDDVLVQAMDPARHVAVLRLPRARGSVPFIPLAVVSAAELAKGPLERVGLPLPAGHPLSAAPVRPAAAPLVRRGAVDLVPLDSGADIALSGGPLLVGGRAAALLASDGQAGSRPAWAVPLPALAALPAVNEAPARIDPWPAAAAASGDGRLALRGPLSAPLVAALDRFGQFIEARTSLRAQALVELTPLGNQAIERYRRAADLAVFRVGPAYRMDELPLDTEVEFVRALGAYGARAEFFDEQFDELDAAGVLAPLAEALAQHFAQRPVAVAGARAREGVLDALRRELGAPDVIQAQLASRAAVFGRIAESYRSVETLGELRRDIERAEEDFGELLEATERLRDTESRRRLPGLVVASLFTAD